jgi:polyhydroxybutyrate depolymerase
MNVRALQAIIAIIVLVAGAASGVRLFHRNPAGDRGMRQHAAADDERKARAAASVAGERHTLMVGDQMRSYYFHRPEQSAGAALPLVIVFHGGEGSALKIATQTGFSEVADRNAFAVAYPESLDHWNDGRTATAGFGDDVRFTSELIDALVQSAGIDRTRVYAVGASNGGLMTLRLACERATEIAAFAAVAASFPDSYVGRCKPAQPVSILIVHGSEDRLIPWRGGTIPSGRRAGVGGTVIAVPDTLEFWRKQDRCRGQPKSKSLPDASDDGTTVEVMEYEGCASGVDMRFVNVIGGGHTWPGARIEPLGRLAGRVSHDIDATQYIWDFLRTHQLTGAAAQDDLQKRS